MEFDNDEYKLLREETLFEIDENGNKNKVLVKIYEKKLKFYENTFVV
jgi:hypothetical protein